MRPLIQKVFNQFLFTGIKALRCTTILVTSQRCQGDINKGVYHYSERTLLPEKKINLTCETKNLIYMIQCNRCNLEYIGETKRRLKDRLNEYRRTIDNPNNKSKPTTAAEHFLSSPNHTAC